MLDEGGYVWPDEEDIADAPEAGVGDAEIGVDGAGAVVPVTL